MSYLADRVRVPNSLHPIARLYQTLDSCLLSPDIQGKGLFASLGHPARGHLSLGDSLFLRHTLRVHACQQSMDIDVRNARPRGPLLLLHPHVLRNRHLQHDHGCHHPDTPDAFRLALEHAGEAKTGRHLHLPPGCFVSGMGHCSHTPGTDANTKTASLE